jgi:UDP-N-acetylglucosamine pyrophosphorylase
MSERVKHAMDYCKKHRQEHLVDYMKPVFSQKSDNLAKQIIKTDFVQINTLYSELITNNKSDDNSGEGILLPMRSYDLKTASEKQKDEMTNLGLDAIRHCEVAAITMAGGQGTRLGHPGPKGTFVLGTNPTKSLFEIQCERLLELHSKTEVYIPWLIMTSEENNSATVEFFEQHDYFGYDSSKIKFFPFSVTKTTPKRLSETVILQ